MSALRSFSSALGASLLLLGCVPGVTSSPQTLPEAGDKPAVAAPPAVVEAGEESPPAAGKDESAAATSTTVAAPPAASAQPTPPLASTPSAALEGDRERLIALLSAYEGPSATGTQLREAAADPIPGLIALSKDGAQSGAVRQGALRALGALGGAEATQRLSGVLASDAIPAEKRAAIQGAALLLPGSDAMRSEVIDHLRDANPGVARAAVQALASDPQSRPALESLSGETVPGPVRTALDEALGLAGAVPRTPEAVPAPEGDKPAGRGGR